MRITYRVIILPGLRQLKVLQYPVAGKLYFFLRPNQYSQTISLIFWIGYKSIILKLAHLKFGKSINPKFFIVSVNVHLGVIAL